jgi:hypothetical protein
VSTVPDDLEIKDVEVKVTIGAEQATEAARAFRLRPDDAEHREIWFCEYLRGQGGPTALPLLEQGVILRLRRKRRGADDATVKIRRGEDEPLLANWRRGPAGEGKLRVEGDWVGRRHMVSASLVAELRDGEIGEAAAGRRSLAKLFSAAQEEVLRAACSSPIDLRALDSLGPVTARKWEPQGRAFEHDIAAEHWRAGELRFLELSIRVPRAAAEAAQDAFDRRIRDEGLQVDAVQETKTRLVLEHFAAARASG